MKIKCQRAQSISEIKSLEAMCGPIPSKTPTQDNWDLIQNNMSDDDDDEKGYSEKKIHMEEILPSLESYRSALQYKKIYLEKKTVLGRLRKDAHSIEQRVGELSANFTDILSMTPPAN
ncbi:hypothetical protein Clacol_000120 [Clathrus columnatus]|uniref:Uncharacterized protein n=1 Tax=Clathrus columnatus TaxID=1419009 RepID=A0AAV4ZYJ4_9AGAM|nr:hypothetical protein Clacol_000120 [Clathrus columnatus]